MGIRLPLEMESGVVIPDAYGKIRYFVGGPANVNFHVDWYVSKAAKQAGKSVIQENDYNVPTPVTEIMAGLYSALKAMPQFSSAVDD